MKLTPYDIWCPGPFYWKSKQFGINLFRCEKGWWFHLPWASFEPVYAPGRVDFSGSLFTHQVFFDNRTSHRNYDFRKAGSYFFLHSQSAHSIPRVVCHIAVLGFIFPGPFAAAGIWTHVSSVALTWDFLKDALLTELPCRGRWIQIKTGGSGFEPRTSRPCTRTSTRSSFSFMPGTCPTSL